MRAVDLHAQADARRQDGMQKLNVAFYARRLKRKTKDKDKRQKAKVERRRARERRERGSFAFCFLSSSPALDTERVTARAAAGRGAPLDDDATTAW
jgi:hypothetical protein